MRWRGVCTGASSVTRSHAVAVCVALSAAPFALAAGALGRAERQQPQQPHGREQPESHGQCGYAVLWTAATACLVTLGFLLTAYALSKRMRELVPHAALTGGAALAACSALANESETAQEGERLLLLVLVGWVVFFAPYVTFRAYDLVLRRYAPMRVVKGLFFSLVMSCGCTLFGTGCVAYVTVSSNLEGSGAFLLNGIVYPCAVILMRRALFSMLCGSHQRARRERDTRDTRDGADNLSHSGVLAFALRMLAAGPQAFVLLSSDSLSSFLFSSISGSAFELFSAALSARLIVSSFEMSGVAVVATLNVRRLMTQSPHCVVPSGASANQARDHPGLPGVERVPEPDPEASGATQDDGPSTSGVAKHDPSASGGTQDYQSASRYAQDGPSASSPLPRASPPLPSEGTLLPTASSVRLTALGSELLVCSEPTAKADSNKLSDLVTSSSKPAFQGNATALLVEILLDYEDCGEMSGLYLGASAAVASRGLDAILLAMIATLLVLETVTDLAKDKIYSGRGIRKRPLDIWAHSYFVLLGLALLGAATVTELFVGVVVACIFS
jgi:hypothetical protein